ncbi:amino acid adenylation domain-containing protein [Acidobacteriota bacterium]
MKIAGLIGRIHRAFDVDIPFSVLFVTPTIRKIYHYIKEAETRIHHSIQWVEEKEYYPLIPTQKRFYVFQQFKPDDISYNMTETMLMEGQLSRERFEAAFRQLLFRQESLRTSFHMIKGEPVQKIHQEVDFVIEYDELDKERTMGLAPLSLELAARKTQLAASTIKDFIRPFDLTRPPLWRVRLVKTAPDKHLLMFDMHHLIADGTSLGIFIRDFLLIYKQEVLPPLKVRYRDYVEWQRWRREQARKISREAPGPDQPEDQLLNLPTDFPRPVVPTFAGETIRFDMGVKESVALHQLSIRQDVTLYMVLLAVYNVLLSKLSGQENIAVGSPIAGRIHVDLDHMVGLFLNTLCLRNQPSSHKTFSTFLKEVKAISTIAFEGQDYQYDELVAQATLVQDKGRNPLYDVMLVLQNMEMPEIDIPGLRVKRDVGEHLASKFDMTLYCEEKDPLVFCLEYSTALFKPGTIKRFIRYFQQIISRVLQDPHQKIADIEIISREEKQQILYEFNDTRAVYPEEKTIHLLFAEQVNNIPDHIAVIGQTPGAINELPLQITYKELNEKSHQLAHLLREKGVKSDTIVGIMVKRSVEMIIGIFGILKVGGAYLPIVPDFPGERINYMLADSVAKILLTTLDLSKGIKFEKEIIYLSDAINRVPTPHHLSFHLSQPSDLAYIIYTSGSTGKPKGVMIQHRSVINRLHWMQRAYPIDGIDVILQKTTVTFDVSVWELFWWSFYGARLCLLGPGEEKDPAAIIETLVRHRVTTMHFVPSMLNAFLDYLDNEDPAVGLRLSTLALKQVFASGEALTVHQVERFNRLLNKSSGPLLVNLYGPTEATVDVSYFNCSPGVPYERIPIGRPIDNIQLYIIDKHNRLLPIGISGGLCIAGIGLARGYLNKPGLNAEKFFYKAFSSLPLTLRRTDKAKDASRGRNQPGTFQETLKDRTQELRAKLYRTGDLARWLPDGNIEFLGRQDQQVKIRGFRIELEEIENQLLRHEEVKEAVLLIKQDQGGDRYLCAYLVLAAPGSRKPFQTNRLRDYLLKSLPDYMIPSFFVPLDQLPLTSSGKVDRKALPAPGKRTGESIVAPRDEIEQKLAGIWAEVLNWDTPIGIDNNFFKSGGHSLKATALVSRIHQVFDVKLPLNEIFKKSTVRQLAESIKGKIKEHYVPINIIETKEYYQLSSAQKRLFFLHQMDEGGTSYNMPYVSVLAGEVNKNKLEKVFLALITRHESLRTSFTMVNDIPVQRVHDKVEFGMEYYQVEVEVKVKVKEKEVPFGQINAFGGEGTRNPEGTRGLAPLLDKFIRPFDLTQAPLFRVALPEVEEEKHLFMVDMHHIISDGMSIELLVQDFMALYSKEELPLMRLQYKDFSAWQNREAQKEALIKQKFYWKNQLQGEIPLLDLPIDFVRPTIQRFEGSAITFEINQEESNVLQSLALSEGITLYMILLACYYILLTKLSNQEDILVGTPTAGRRHMDLEPIIGMFVNTLVLRNYPTSEQTYRGFLKEIKKRSLQAFENQDYHYEELVEELSVTRDATRNPFFDTMFVNQNIGIPRIEIPGLTLTPLVHQMEISKFDLTLIGMEVEGRLSLTLEYSTNLFKRSTIERFIAYFKKIVSIVAAHPDVHIRDVEILLEEEKQQILYDFNDTTADYPKDKVLYELFAEQAEKNPDGIAVIGPAQSAGERHAPSYRTPVKDTMGFVLTYKELDRRSHRLAHLLKDRGGKPDTIMGIMVERSIEMILGILAILEAGGVYLPVDTDYPEERKKFMLDDSATHILLTSTLLTKKIRFKFPGEIIPLDDPDVYSDNRKEAFTDKAPEQVNKAGDLVYIMYTSGSTGGPKGVLVEHRNVMRLVVNTNYIQLTGDTRILQTGAPVFDATTFEIWGALLNGGQLVLVEKEVTLDANRLGQAIVRNKINTLWLTSPLFNQLIREKSDIFSSLDYLLVGGDILSPEFINLARNKSERLKVINGYGPTENATFSTTFLIDRDFEEAIPIGSPIRNSTAYIVNRWGGLQPVGIFGELWVAGDGISRGYLNRPGLTREKFVKAPFIKGKRLYRTGDIARWLPDGNIEFSGRIDTQVKIRGYRIELGEIERQLLQHSKINQSVVLAREDNADKALCAYVLADEKIEVAGLRKFLANKLPGYMIPDYFIWLDRVPLTPNGKIDRKALPRPVLQPGDRYVAPRSGIEKKLAAIWSEVLGTVAFTPVSIGIDDDFFQLGGHSLKAVILASRINQVFHVNIPLAEIFKTPSIRGLTCCIQSREKVSHASIEPVEKKDYYVISSAQKRLYILQQLAEGSIGYNMPFFFALEGEVDKRKLEDVFSTLIKRHESLHTSFHMVADESVQRVYDEVQFEMEYHDMSEVEVKNFIRPFDLSRAPLLRVRLIRNSENQHILMLDMNHAIFDGISLNILVKEFMAFYAGEELPALRLQYKDFSKWQTHEKQKEVLLKQEAYWRSQLEGEIPVLDLPVNYPRPAIQSFEGSKIDFEINRWEVKELKSLALETGTTLFMILLAIYNIFLSKLSSQEDILIGTPTAGRRHADLEQIIGMFVNTLVLRNYPGGEKTYTVFLNEIKERSLAAFENQDYPYENLVEELSVTRDTSRNPLFDTMFAKQNMEISKIEIPGLTLNPYDYHTGTSKFDLTLMAFDTGEDLLFTFEYCTKLFRRKTIQRFIRYFKKIVSSILTEQNVKISEIEITPEEEKQKILFDFNRNRQEYPGNKPLHHLFAQQVERRPDGVALVYEDHWVTYGELSKKANQWAQLFRQKEVRPDTIAAIMVGPSIEMISGILGILKAGAAYLPIDPGCPADRARFMLADSSANILITTTSLYEDMKLGGWVDGKNLEIVFLDFSTLQPFYTPTLPSLHLHQSLAPATCLAYLIYTSGSTGKPKGVQVEHRSLSNLCHWHNKHYSVTCRDRAFKYANFGFDASVWEIFPYLIKGASIYLLNDNIKLDFHRLNDYFEANRISIGFLPTQICEQFMGIRNRSLRVLLTGGDKLKRFIKREYRLANNYGPTENTVVSTSFIVDGNYENIPIGRPISNTQLYILNKHNNIQPVGIPGKLCICGDSLARGYLNRPELTAEKFYQDKNNQKFLRGGPGGAVF